VLLVWVLIGLWFFFWPGFYPEFRVTFRFVDEDFCDKSMGDFVELVTVVQ
jgi:hypothetical protein